MTTIPTTPGIVVSTAITAGAHDEGYQSQQHSEGIVVSTAISAGARDEGYESQQHSEGVVVSTAITAGAAGDDCPLGTCNGQNNHVEGLVR